MDYTLALMKKIFAKYERQGRITPALLDPILSQDAYLSDYFGKMHRLRKDLRSLNKKGDKFGVEDKKEEIKELKCRYEAYIEEYLQNELDWLHDKDYQLELKKVTEDKNEDSKIKESNIKGPALYQVEPTLGNLLLMRMLNRNLRSCYKVQPANRFTILHVLRDLLEERHDVILLRLDIKSFFESIPFDELLDKLKEDGILCPESFKLLEQIKKSYTDKSNANVGIPRGVPCSSFLSEIYMRDVDSRIKSLPGVYYYARYVDDMIVLVYPKDVASTPSDYYDKIYQIVHDKGLELHPKTEGGKTKLIDNRKSRNFSFSYLGYHIQVQDGDVSFSLSDDKYKHYEEWLRQAFATFKKDLSGKKQQGRNSLTRLLHQLRMMTSNYPLAGSKHFVMSGIFYKYPLLTNTSQLSALDGVLAEELGKLTVEDIPAKMGNFDDRKFSPKETLDYITKRCSKYSFVKGFLEVKTSHIFKDNFEKYKQLCHEEIQD